MSECYPANMLVKTGFYDMKNSFILQIHVFFHLLIQSVLIDCLCHVSTDLWGYRTLSVKAERDEFPRYSFPLAWASFSSFVNWKAGDGPCDGDVLWAYTCFKSILHLFCVLGRWLLHHLGSLTGLQLASANGGTRRSSRLGGKRDLVTSSLLPSCVNTCEDPSHLESPLQGLPLLGSPFPMAPALEWLQYCPCLLRHVL